MTPFTSDLDSLHRDFSHVQSRSISAENPDGRKGGGAKAEIGTGSHYARELGKGWKMNPYMIIEPGTTQIIADISGPGEITHMWFTADIRLWRNLIVRIFWDHEENPSVAVPLGDFFANGWCELALVNSIPISVNPAGGLNSYWRMPFREHACITIEYLTPSSYQTVQPATLEPVNFFYQIDYLEKVVEANALYFHTQWNRSNPLEYKVPHCIVRDIKGRGRYIGTYLSWQVNSNDWWGEGEVKFFLDGDKEYPTICGTGTEDYFGGAWNWEFPKGSYRTYSTPYLGMHQVITPDGLYHSQQRFGMYRWHIPDPIYFEENLTVTIQALGIGTHERFHPNRDDIASTAFWYQNEPHASNCSMLDFDVLEV